MRAWIIVALALAVAVPGDSGPALRKISPPPTISLVAPSQSPLMLTASAFQAQSGRDFSDVAAAELVQVRGGESLREFIKSHPDREPRPNNKEGDPQGRFGDYCALSRTNVQLNSGAKLEQVAVFFLPPVPTPVVPPSPKDPAEMLGDCLLGEIYLAAPVPDPSEAQKIAAALRTRLSGLFGDPERLPQDEHFRSASLYRMQWKVGNVNLGTGYDTYKIRSTDLPQFMAYAYNASIIQAERNLLAWWQQLDLRVKPNANFQLAVTTAALDPVVSAAVTDVYDRSSALAAKGGAYGNTTRERLPSLTEIVTVLRQWLKEVNGLSPRRRAAAFLTAYYVVDVSEAALSEQPRVRRTLAQLGSVYWKPNPSQGDDSRGQWLGLAFSLDPKGQIGDAIVFEQMHNECYFRGFFGDPVPLFQRVIIDGESYLSRTHNPADSALAEYLLASAYEDLVSVASGGLAGEESPNEEQPLKARENALKHYARAINSNPGPTVARAAWRESWKLLANLPPRNLHYHCYSGE